MAVHAGTTGWGGAPAGAKERSPPGPGASSRRGARRGHPRTSSPAPHKRRVTVGRPSWSFSRPRIRVRRPTMLQPTSPGPPGGLYPQRLVARVTRACFPSIRRMKEGSGWPAPGRGGTVRSRHRLQRHPGQRFVPSSSRAVQRAAGAGHRVLEPGSGVPPGATFGMLVRAFSSVIFPRGTTNSVFTPAGGWTSRKQRQEVPEHVPDAPSIRERRRGPRSGPMVETGGLRRAFPTVTVADPSEDNPGGRGRSGSPRWGEGPTAGRSGGEFLERGPPGWPGGGEGGPGGHGEAGV